MAPRSNFMSGHEKDERPGRHAPEAGGRRGPDPRLLGLLAIVFVIALAVLLAYFMNSLNHADQCLASGGRSCG
jgi:hypothetical protein